MAFVYSCCFWFSLRLGGILIGIYSIALAVFVLLCLGYTNSERFKTTLTELTDEMILIYTKEYVENLISDPERYFKMGIGLTSVYIIVSFVFIYGAYTAFVAPIIPTYLSILHYKEILCCCCNNMLMIAYILFELVRLIVLSITLATALLVLKQNTMDIGLLIGASVAVGFFLLGEFYLWVCAANLPILVNEIEHDEQAATIEKLQQLLQINNQRNYNSNLENIPLATDYGNHVISNDVFVVQKKATSNFDKFRSRTEVPDPYINTYFTRR